MWLLNNLSYELIVCTLASVTFSFKSYFLATGEVTLMTRHGWVFSAFTLKVPLWDPKIREGLQGLFGLAARLLDP